MITGCAETTEPIEILFGAWTRVRPTNHVLNGARIAQRKKTILRASLGRSQLLARGLELTSGFYPGSSEQHRLFLGVYLKTYSFERY